MSRIKTTHGAWRNGAETGAHMSWRNMMERCTRKTNNRFTLYGARGIAVCTRWKKFEHFLADMGERPLGMTLERNDNDKGYGPDNCKWATQQDQQNHRRNNHLLTHDSKTQTIAQWAREVGMSYSLLSSRIRMGISPERALTPKLLRAL